MSDQHPWGGTTPPYGQGAPTGPGGPGWGPPPAGPPSWGAPGPSWGGAPGPPTGPAWGAPAPAYGQPAPWGGPAWPGGTGGHRRVGKVRNPWGVWALYWLTCGIYGFYWWYKVNEEARDYDASVKVDPTLALLALFVPIASLVTTINTGSRIGQVERNAGMPDRCSGGIGFLLAILFGFHAVYYQSHLNKVWARHGNQPPGTYV